MRSFILFVVRFVDSVLVIATFLGLVSSTFLPILYLFPQAGVKNIGELTFASILATIVLFTLLVAVCNFEEFLKRNL